MLFCILYCHFLVVFFFSPEGICRRTIRPKINFYVVRWYPAKCALMVKNLFLFICNYFMRVISWKKLNSAVRPFKKESSSYCECKFPPESYVLLICLKKSWDQNLWLLSFFFLMYFSEWLSPK